MAARGGDPGRPEFSPAVAGARKPSPGHQPGDGAIGITWGIGWFAFLFGSLELWLASAIRHESLELTRQSGLGVSRSVHAES
jgi:hypothetical protein